MRLPKLVVITLFGFILSLPAASYAAVDMFLEIDGVKGESRDSAKKEAIDVLAWSWGSSSSASGRRIQCSIQDVSVTKYVDAASPDLLMGQLDGHVYRTAKLTVRKAGDTPLEYIVIEFNDVRITSVSTGGSGGEDRLTENISFNFSSAVYTYTPQTIRGSRGDARQATIGGC